MMTSAAAGGERRRSPPSRLLDGKELFPTLRQRKASENLAARPARTPGGRRYGFSVIRIL